MVRKYEIPVEQSRYIIYNVFGMGSLLVMLDLMFNDNVIEYAAILYGKYEFLTSIYVDQHENIALEQFSGLENSLLMSDLMLNNYLAESVTVFNSIALISLTYL